MTTAPPIDRGSRAEQFVRRLHRAHRERDPNLAAARRWRPGRVDIGVAALTFLGAEAASVVEYPIWAQTAKLYVLWHSGRIDTANGYPGSGIGSWAHQLGVGDPAAERLIARIVAANDAAQLDAGLTVLGDARTARPPHWGTVMIELAAWADPVTRDETRLRWAHDFYRFPPKSS